MFSTALRAQPVDANTGTDEGSTTTKPKSARATPADQGSTLQGLSGLFRLVTADIGARHTFRLALHSEFFSGSNFLVNRDKNERFTAILAASYTPWRYVEFALSARSQVNRNTQFTPEIIHALGDITLGGKGQYPLTPYLALGGNIELSLLNAVGDIALDANAVGVYVGGLASLSIQPLVSFPLPVRVHANVGFRLDNSSNLIDDSASALNSNPTQSTLRAAEVQGFAYGLRPSRAELRFGVEAELRRWTHISARPIAELSLAMITADHDAVYDSFAANGLIPTNGLSGRSSASLTLGVRVSPLPGLSLDLATDIGLDSPGYGFGPPVMPWNLILGLAYNYDPTHRAHHHSHPIKSQEHATSVRHSGQGRIHGKVVDAYSGNAISGAVITFPGRDLTGLYSDPDGHFLSYPLPPGDIHLMVRHPDHLPQKAMAKIVADGKTSVAIKLRLAAQKPGTVRGKTVNAKDQGVPATLEFKGPEDRKITTDESGRFDVQLQPGDYALNVTGRHGFRIKHRFTLTSDTNLNVVLAITDRAKNNRSRRRRPTTKRTTRKKLPTPRVKVRGRRIIISREIHFASGSSRLQRSAKPILSAVGRFLRENPALGRVDVQGHTDNRGDPELNMKISRARAQAVRLFLVSAGIRADRLTATGYGSTKARRPNISEANRSANRRVEFVIRSTAP